jgi:pyruvate,water dikinase
MASLFSWLFRRKDGKDADEAGESAFAARFHRFRLFLTAYLGAYTEMMSFEERLAKERPFGMSFLRLCMTRLTVASMQCVLQLNTLAGGRFERLNGPFSKLRSDVQTILDKGATPLSGPLLIPYSAVDETHEAIVSPSLYKLRTIREAHPELMPGGFVVSGAAWWLYFNNPDMHDEIDRIMLISQEDSAGYGEAAATIRERIAASFPLPDALVEAVRESLAGCPELDLPGHILLLRCLPVRAEHGALVIPEQVLHTPVDAKRVLEAIRASLSMAYRPGAIIYRMKRGIRDRAMPMCIAVAFIPEAHARGSAHRGLESLNPEELLVHVRRGFATPQTWLSRASDGGASLPDDMQKQMGTALACLSDAPAGGSRHEVFWAASASGRLSILGADTLPEPSFPDRSALPPALSEDAMSGQASPVSAIPDTASSAGLFGGLGVYPGLAAGKAFPVRNFRDALDFPLGGILVLQQASPRWSFLLDFAAGAVVGDGTDNGMFAHAARRYGRPAILRQPQAFERLAQGEPVRVMAGVDHVPSLCLESGPADSVWRGRIPQWLPASDLAEMARELAPKVASLTLPDSDHVEFRAENCRTFYDILTYCHVNAVREMLRAGTAGKSASAPAKQLICDVPKQFWIINLDDGFYGKVNGPVVHLEQIASLPMRALWEGFTDKPWEGPPQLDAKGFLSVLFEASANPSLDPASQSTLYTEKNVFLIAGRFCSMRCRFGFHFLSLDCLLGEREGERFIIFQFKGGAANLARRIRRVHFVAELLSQFDFSTEIVGDSLTARLEFGGEKDFVSALRVLGYITMHTRQLDMIMGDEQALASRRLQMLEDMLALAARSPLVLPANTP